MATDSILWKIHLFDGPYLVGSGQTIKKFRSSKGAALLSYLALHFEKPCSREALIEALWPGETDMATLHNRFRVTLASLRRQIEPEGFPFGSVLDTSLPGCVSLTQGSTWCDVAEFEKAYSRGDLNTSSDLLRGPLLPGFYDSWASDLQIRYQVLRDEIPRAGVQEPAIQGPLSSQDQHRLPRFLSTMFGRESEMAALGTLLKGNRLVTVTGPGGVGKTRIAIEASRQSSLKTQFVSLTDCVDWTGLIDTTIQQFAVVGQNNPDSVAQLLEILQEKGEMRLLFDNADHIIEEVRELVFTLLNASGQIQILVTSRQALDIEGEQIYRLAPLSTDADESGRSASVQLFLDRLRQSRPDVSESSTNLRLISDICGRLEGLPLALELAAAQITVLSLSEISELLTKSIIELRSRRRSLAKRHHSIRLAIESSFVGLDASTQLFLGAVSVLCGGFTAKQAFKLTNDSRTLERLDDLVHRSLLSTDAESDTVRFQCLEVIRQLAQERLSSEVLSSLLDRHADMMLSLAAAIDEGDLGSLTTLDGEDQNLSAALQHANSSHPLYWKARSGAILRSFIRGQYRTALRWIKEEEPAEANDQDKQRWWNVSSQVLIDLELFDLAEEMISTARNAAVACGDAVSEAYQTIFLGLLRERKGDATEAVRLHRKGLELARCLGDRALLQCAISHLAGSLRTSVHSLGLAADQARPVLVEARDLALELLSRVDAASRRNCLAYLLAGSAELDLGEPSTARAHLEQAETTARESGILTVQMFAAFTLSRLAQKLGLQELQAQKGAEFSVLKSATGILSNHRWDAET